MKIGVRKQELIIDPKKTALLIIDMQEAFLNNSSPLKINGANRIVPVINRLIEKCRSVGIPIIFTRIYHDTASKLYRELFPAHFDVNGRPVLTRDSQWFHITSRLDVRATDTIIDKERYSAFYRTPLRTLLESKGIDTIIVCGLASNVCCESTIRDAFSHDIRSIFVTDANITLNKNMHKSTLTNVKLAFGYVTSSKRLMSHLMSLSA
jgi:ureidoacrylate peracid hydrolase